MMWSLLATLFLVGLRAVEAQDQCYYAAGQKALDNYVPCSSGSGFASCCLAGDYCLADGACYGPGTKMTYIAGCTDESYSDGTCKGGSGTCDKSSQFQGLAMCGSSWVCCGGDGQHGDIPGNDYTDTCPCDAGYGTAIASAGTLAAVTSLGTAFATHSAAASSTSSAAPTSAAATTTSASSSESSAIGSGAANSDSSSAAVSSSTTLQTIPVSINSGITGTGVGSGPAAASTSAAPVSSSSGGLSQSGKIGLGVGLPLGAALIGAIGVALFCLRRRQRGKPQYVTQADLSTPVWVGETPGSGMPAPRDQGAYAAAGGAGAGAGGWKAERNSSGSVGPMREVAQTPPPQYQNSPDHPQSHGIWQPQRLQALQ